MALEVQPNSLRFDPSSLTLVVDIVLWLMLAIVKPLFLFVESEGGRGERHGQGGGGMPYVSGQHPIAR